MVGELPELCRVWVLADCRVKAAFSDNTLLALNSTGSSFLITTPDGRSTRQLSEYALARHSPLLAAVLEFRNMHSELPCFCKPLARALRSSFTLGYLVQDATWPNPSRAVSAGLAQLQPDGKVAVSSEDGVAQVVLHGHRRRFAVCYPLLVAERPQEAKYEYVWQTQVFSVASHPARWQAAVRTALQAAPQLGWGQGAQAVGANGGRAAQQERQQQVQQQSGLQQPQEQGTWGTSSAALQLDQDSDCGSGGGGGGDAASVERDGGTSEGTVCDGAAGREPSAGRRNELPSAGDCLRAGLAEQLRSDEWWGEPSLSLLPPEEVVLFEWTPHATYQFLPEAGEVEVWVHADESCLVSTRGGRFLAHYRGGGGAEGGGGEQLYAANCVPDAVWSQDQACRYPLGSLAAHALKLRSHNTNVTAAIAARVPCEGAAHLHPLHGHAHHQRSGGGRVGQSTDELFAAASSVLLEESVVPGHARFAAYEDGRVRAGFNDRTILHMSASHSHCKVVLPDGRQVVVAASNPVGVEGYVAAAMDFARWAFKTPAERAGELRQQARVRAELLNSQRMVQLCEYGTSGALPPPALLAAGGGARASPAQPLVLAGAGPVRDGEDGKVLGGGRGEGPMEIAGVAGMPERGHEHGVRSDGAGAVPLDVPFAGMDRQAMIEALLGANARLLERL